MRFTPALSKEPAHNGQEVDSIHCADWYHTFAARPGKLVHIEELIGVEERPAQREQAMPFNKPNRRRQLAFHRFSCEREGEGASHLILNIVSSLVNVWTASVRLAGIAMLNCLLTFGSA